MWGPTVAAASIVLDHAKDMSTVLLIFPAMLTLLALLVAGSAHLNRDMFTLMWGPTVAAVSIVLESAEDMSIVLLETTANLNTAA